MSTLFVDTSSLVKFYYPEQDSDAVEVGLLGAERVYLSELTRVEFVSAIARKVRAGEIGKSEFARLTAAFNEDCLALRFSLVALGEDILIEARSLVERLGLDYALRTLDGLQLASAMRSGADGFLCHDERLAQVAATIGFKVVAS